MYIEMVEVGRVSVLEPNVATIYSNEGKPWASVSQCGSFVIKSPPGRNYKATYEGGIKLISAVAGANGEIVCICVYVCGCCLCNICVFIHRDAYDF